jgi:galactokinase
MNNPSASYPTGARVACSPGRIEFIGNHTDYNGGQVLGVALNLNVEAIAVPRHDDQLVFSSEGAGAVFEGPLGGIEPQSGAVAWANYPLGIIRVLEEAGHRLSRGLNLSFRSDLPTGAGLSSSAAIELATLEVICALEGIELDRKDKVLLAQRAENTFVGVPCGMLDQAVSCYGRRDHLVRIDCATTEFRTVPMPGGLHFHVFNTNHKHSLVDSMYAQRHAECREALACIRKQVPDLKHLVEAPLDALGVMERGSAIRRRAEHVIREHLRVGACADALAAGDLRAAGDLLFASHASSRDLFENSIPQLDTLVELLEGRRDAGVIGARLTGGGFGGAVMALTTGEFGKAKAEAVLEQYRLRHPDSEEPAWLHVTTGDGTRLLA